MLTDSVWRYAQLVRKLCPVLKDYNLRRRYMKKYAPKFSACQRMVGKDKIEMRKVCYTAQFVISIRVIDNEYNIVEEMIYLVPLKNAIKSLRLYEAVKRIL